tara:strand:+ start:225 stop:431 length:207 start_codon:yes stop_codon:yes gene_type:complete
MINLQLTLEQASALRNTLLLHTSKDSFEYPSSRVVLIREVISELDKEIETDSQIISKLEEQTDYGVGK